MRGRVGAVSQPSPEADSDNNIFVCVCVCECLHVHRCVKASVTAALLNDNLPTYFRSEFVRVCVCVRGNDYVQARCTAGAC